MQRASANKICVAMCTRNCNITRASEVVSAIMGARVSVDCDSTVEVTPIVPAKQGILPI